MFCYQTAAYRRGEGIASVITFGSPVDTARRSRSACPRRSRRGAAGSLADTCCRAPGAARLGQPHRLPHARPGQGACASRSSFVRQLHDREALLPRERQRRFLQDDGWVAWPGPALAELLRQFVAHNRMLSGGFVIDGPPRHARRHRLPDACFVGEVDEIAAAPARARHPPRRAAGRHLRGHPARRALRPRRRLDGARRARGPPSPTGSHWREGDGPLPVHAVQVDDVAGDGGRRRRPGNDRRAVGHGVEPGGRASAWSLARARGRRHRSHRAPRPRALARGRA